jgi:hypothetical protein
MIEFGPVREGNVPQGSRRVSTSAEPTQCRELVAVSPVAPRQTSRRTPGPRSFAPFLAHLIATAEDHPQTREKRRLPSDEAARRYGTMQARPSAGRARLGSL